MIIKKIIGYLKDCIFPRTRSLEEASAAQEKRILGLEQREAGQLHELEVKEEDRRGRQEFEETALSDDQFKSKLTSKYGRSGWAKRLIDELVSRRGGRAN